MLFKANHSLPDVIGRGMAIPGRHLEIGMSQDFFDKEQVYPVVYQPTSVSMP